MAAYGYRCPYCGPFEWRANSRAAGAPAPCPTCGSLSPRTYQAPGGRGPRRARQLEGVGRDGRERIDRAQAGVPTVGGVPAGRRLHGGVPVSSGHTDGPARPWQIGH
ncbi:MAG: hypothetical protein ACR2KV_16785 [Solirubrobacteraceae bacterium]